ncbi:unnamed protein product, partial [Ectocarpus sp. 4 AP-2014]
MEDEEEEEEEEDQVKPSSSGRKRQKREHREGAALVVGDVIGSRHLALYPPGSLPALRGLRIVVPPPPGRASLVRNARVGRFAVGDEDEDFATEERGSSQTVSTGVIVEFCEDWGVVGDPGGRAVRS